MVLMFESVTSVAARPFITTASEPVGFLERFASFCGDKGGMRPGTMNLMEGCSLRAANDHRGLGRGT